MQKGDWNHSLFGNGIFSLQFYTTYIIFPNPPFSPFQHTVDAGDEPIHSGPPTKSDIEAIETTCI